MDKETLSHYGWIVVMLLCLSLMILIATPFGKYVRTATWNYIVSFFDASDEAVDNIENNKEHNDINLNGSFIVTDRQGNPTCYVFGVNGSYDGYSLEGSGTAPNVEDRYFRCVRYANIEERRTIKEMFHLAAELGYDDTAEGRQGIQSALLHFVTGDDYGDYASNISSIARNVYDDLLAKSGSLDHEEYDYVKLVAIEKDGHIDMVIMSLTGNFDATYDPSTPKGWQVPKNGQYVMVSDNGGYGKTVYNEFEYLPYGYECQIGDTYTDDGYIFTYQKGDYSILFTAKYSGTGSNKYSEITWIPVVKDKTLSSYPDIINEINYAPIKLLTNTFTDCKNLVKTPRLPDTVIDMTETFKNCSSLISVTNIPTSLINMQCTFQNCTSLENFDGKTIPNTVMSMDRTFRGCTSLTSFNKLPDGLMFANEVFNGCTSLKTAPMLSEKLVYAPKMFKDCLALTDVSNVIIPNRVKNIEGMFEGCTSLTTAPDMSNATKLEEIGYLFYLCENLKTYHGSTDADGDFSNYYLPTSILDMQYTFFCCDLMVIAPDIPNSVTSMKGTFSGCKSLTTAPLLHEGITNLGSTFLGCTSLKTYHSSTDADGDFRNYILPSTLKETTDNEYRPLLSATFMECTSMKYAPAIPSGVMYLDRTFFGSGLIDEGIPVISNTVVKMYETFGKCLSLRDLSNYTIPNSVTDMTQTFIDCVNLEKAPSLPSSVVKLNGTFRSCEKLTDISKVVIPNTAKDVSSMFFLCRNLSGSVIVNADIETLKLYNGFIKNTQITSIEGTCSDELKTILMETKNS